MADAKIDLGNVVGADGATGSQGAQGAPGADGHTPTAAEIRAAFNGETVQHEIAEDTTVAVSPNTMYSITATEDGLTVTFVPDVEAIWADGDFFFAVLSAGTDGETPPTQYTVAPQFSGNIKMQGDTTASALFYIYGVRIGDFWAISVN